ncbi:MAG: hypothetical protein EXR21_04060 [Flavobacteriaceae bacterium]|nr:hypothetical protein [Flavobacteriaceae bacterium]
MALYRFKISLEDYEDFFRTIDIHSTQTFQDLHLAIQDSVGFDKSQLASFYMSDDQWKRGFEVTLENMTNAEDENDDKAMPMPVMKDCRLCDYIDDPHQKILYVFDFINMWTFYCEMTGIILEENPKLTYPAVVKSEGLAPKQYVDKKFVLVDDEEFEEITESILGNDHEDGLDEGDEELITGVANDEEEAAPPEEFGAEGDKI